MQIDRRVEQAESWIVVDHFQVLTDRSEKRFARLPPVHFPWNGHDDFRDVRRFAPAAEAGIERKDP